MGELWQLGDEPRPPRRRVRIRTLRRWSLPALAALGLAASLAALVRRAEEGRSLAERIGELEAKAQIVADRILSERVRADSLTAPGRIEEVAAGIGLRPAIDGEQIRVRAGRPAEEPNVGTRSGGTE